MYEPPSLKGAAKDASMASPLMTVKSTNGVDGTSDYFTSENSTR